MTIQEGKQLEKLMDAGFALVNSLKEISAEEYQSKEREIAYKFNPIMERIYKAANVKKPDPQDTDEVGDLD